MRSIASFEDLNKFLVEAEQRKLDKRVLAYVTAVIRKSGQGYCDVQQAKIRKAVACRKQKITDSLRRIVDAGKLERYAAENRNRTNPKYYYFLPNGEPIGNSNKSLFISTVLSGTEELKIDRKLDLSGLDSWKNLNRLELIEKYFDAGFCITPLIELGKKPLAKWRRDICRSKTKNQLLEFFAANENLNVGCWLPEEIIVIDVDDEDAFFEVTAGETWETLKTSSGRGSHLWFRNDLKIGRANGVRPHLDFKAGNGSLVVLPPSIHKSGSAYEWEPLTEPIAVPHLFRELYDSRSYEKDSIVPCGLEKVQRSTPFITSETVIETGERYNQLFRLGRSLRHRLAAAELASELQSYNQRCCRPPLDDRRLQKLIRDVRDGKDRPDWKLNSAS